MRMENTDNKKQRLATAANTPKQLSFYVVIFVGVERWRCVLSWLNSQEN